MRPDGGSKWLVIVAGMLNNEGDQFWDNRTTVNVIESRDEILRQAMVSARRELTVQIGKNPDDWAWGTLHQLTLEHPVLGGESIPAPVRWLVNPRAVGVSGGSSIVNATSWDAGSDSYVVTAGPSMRMVVDMGNLDGSTWLALTGTSGHPGSSHYIDQLGAWVAGTTFPFPFSRSAVEAAGAEVLTLSGG
jgi:penicillin amidase